MHLLHHRRGGNRGHEKPKQKRMHRRETCYNCGRQFIKHNDVLIHRSKRGHCPGCHSKYEHIAEAAEKSSEAISSPFCKKSKKKNLFASSRKKTKGVFQSEAVEITPTSSFASSGAKWLEIEDGNEDGRETSGRGDPYPFASTYETEGVESYQTDYEHSAEGVEAYQLFAASRKKTKRVPQSAAVEMTKTSSFDSSGAKWSEIEDANEDSREMSGGGDPCPFAFTYETEEVESYQSDYGNSTEGVESYQLEWLLFNVL